MAEFRTINEYPVTYRTAQLLHQAGFNEKTAYYYYADGILREGTPPQANHDIAPLVFPAPTIEQAVMFIDSKLRFCFGIDITGCRSRKDRLAAYNSVMQFCITKYLEEHESRRITDR